VCVLQLIGNGELADSLADKRNNNSTHEASPCKSTLSSLSFVSPSNSSSLNSCPLNVQNVPNFSFALRRMIEYDNQKSSDGENQKSDDGDNQKSSPRENQKSGGKANQKASNEANHKSSDTGNEKSGDSDKVNQKSSPRENQKSGDISSDLTLPSREEATCNKTVGAISISPSLKLVDYSYTSSQSEVHIIFC